MSLCGLRCLTRAAVGSAGKGISLRSPLFETRRGLRRLTSCAQQPLTLALHPTGTIGHVAHGKSQTVKAISGVQTVRFKNELERNITIKLGYANAKVRSTWSTTSHERMD